MEFSKLGSSNASSECNGATLPCPCCVGLRILGFVIEEGVVKLLDIRCGGCAIKFGQLGAENSRTRCRGRSGVMFGN